jgi:hypothetical protein
MESLFTQRVQNILQPLLGSIPATTNLGGCDFSAGVESTSECCWTNRRCAVNNKSTSNARSGTKAYRVPWAISRQVQQHHSRQDEVLQLCRSQVAGQPRQS